MPKVDISEELGQTIRELRNKMNIQISDLATSVKRSVGFIFNIEHSKTKSMDIKDLLNIFEYLIKDEEERSKVVSELFKKMSIHYTAQELKKQKWFEIYDKEYRLLPIPEEYIKFLKESLNQLNITAYDLVDTINQNIGLENKHLPDNEVIIRVFPDGRQSLSIKFNLKPNYIHEIINGNIKKANYITLEGILYNIFYLRGLTPTECVMEAEKTLYNFKIYTSNELRMIMQDAKLDISFDDITSSEVVQTSLPQETQDNIKLISNLVKFLRMMSDTDIDYINEQISSLNKSLDATPSFIINLFGIPFYKMGNLPTEKQKELYIKINKLFNDFFDEQTNQEKTTKIEIEKF